MTKNDTQYHNGGDKPRTVRVVQLRRGTATENDKFTGAIGEVTMDTTAKTLRVHDGETPGGTALARQSTLDTADYVVEYQMPTEANGYTWYRKYKSGWVEQGTYTGEISVGATFTFTFPVKYKNQHSYFIIATGALPNATWMGGSKRTTTFCIIKNNHATEPSYIDIYTCGMSA